MKKILCTFLTIFGITDCSYSKEAPWISIANEVTRVTEYRQNQNGYISIFRHSANNEFESLVYPEIGLATGYVHVHGENHDRSMIINFSGDISRSLLDTMAISIEALKEIGRRNENVFTHVEINLSSRIPYGYAILQNWPDAAEVFANFLRHVPNGVRVVFADQMFYPQCFTQAIANKLTEVIVPNTQNYDVTALTDMGINVITPAGH